MIHYFLSTVIIAFLRYILFKFGFCVQTCHYCCGLGFVRCVFCKGWGCHVCQHCHGFSSMGGEADTEGAAMCSACNDTHHEQLVNLYAHLLIPLQLANLLPSLSVAVKHLFLLLPEILVFTSEMT